MKLSPKRAENLSITALILHLIFFLLALFFDKFSGSRAVGVVGWLYLAGLPIWAVLVIQFRQRRLADEEKFEAREYQRLKKEGRSASVFEGDIEKEMMVQQKRLDWIEKWMLPFAATIVTVYLIGIGIWQWSIVKGIVTSVAGDMPLVKGMELGKTIVVLAGMSVVSFLFACYTIGMSRQDEWRPLRAGGGFLIGCTLASLSIASTLTATSFGYYNPLIIAGKVLVIIMLVLGIEFALNVTMDFFRPRMKGQYQRAAFESRILGLFSEPGGLFRTASHALDYQFGFKVSETWFYRLLEKYIVSLVLIQAAVLYLMTCFAIVPTGHQAVLERWGAPLNLDKPWEAGLHFKMPYPMDIVKSFPVYQIKSLAVGYENNDPKYNYKGMPVHDTTPVLWSKEHWKAEYPFLVPAKKAGHEEAGEGSVNNLFDKLVFAVDVQYRIDDVKKYAYQKASFIEPDKVIQQLCERTILHHCSQNDIEQILGPGRNDTAQMLRRKISEEFAKYDVGVSVDYVGIKSVHPPIKVAEAFEKVISALQQKQTKILKAQGQSHMSVNRAEADAAVNIAAANAYKNEREKLAQADAERFAKQVEAYDKGGDVYLWREYLSVQDEYMPAMRKYLIASDNVDDWVYEFDLKENIKPDLFKGLGLDNNKEENAQK